MPLDASKADGDPPELPSPISHVHADINFLDSSIPNIKAVLQRAESSPDVMTYIFGSLLKPDQNPNLLAQYCAQIRLHIIQSRSGTNYTARAFGLNAFGKACFDGGIVKTILALVKEASFECHGACIGGYFGVDAISHLAKTGSIHERNHILDQLLENDLVDLFLEKIKCPVGIMRHASVTTFNAITAECFLAKRLTPVDLSRIITSMCEYVLAGPASFIDEVDSRKSSWQDHLIMGTATDTPLDSLKMYMPRYYATSQESALVTVLTLVGRPALTKQTWLEILQHNPNIIQMLFKCTLLRRTAWYPESIADCLACEILALLFHFPSHLPQHVPPHPTHLPEERAILEEAAAEWKAMKEIIGLFTSNGGVENIKTVWAKFTDEKWQTVNNMLFHARKTYIVPVIPPRDATVRGGFMTRGVARLCILRIITTVTYEADGITDTELKALLHIGASATMPIPETIDVMSLNDQEEYYTWVERSQELFKDICTLQGPPSERALAIPSQLIMGPLLSTRFLAVMAHRGTIQKVIEPFFMGPANSGSVTPGATDAKPMPQNIFAKAQSRVTACKDAAARSVESRQLEYARFLYVSAAELASAIVDFDVATKQLRTHSIPEIYKLLVICLGNAAEVSLRLGQPKRALGYAMSAIQVGENAPPSQAVDESLMKKNKKRKEAAINSLSLS